MRHDVTTAFQQLSWLPKRYSIEYGNITIIRFLSYIYTKTDMDLNKARLSVYMTSVKDSLRVLPPSSDALKLHIRRSCYQAGWIWGNTLSQQESTSPEQWGWYIHQDRLIITGATTSSLGALRLAKIITTCKCVKVKCTSCKCATIGCLKYCSCKRACTH